MTKQEIKSLDSIIARLEILQNKTNDREAKDLMGKAKSELIRLYQRQS